MLARVVVLVAGLLLVVGLGLPVAALGAGDANEAVCPNEGSPGFRASLSDCRGFELVSPPFGGGQPVFGISHEEPQMSADGEHLLGVSFGDFAGTENLEESSLEYGAIYEFSRTAGGWSTEALDPPASAYPRREFFMASADLSRSLWGVAVPAHGGEELGTLPPSFDGYTLAVREAAGGGRGRFTLVGPVVHEIRGEAEGGFHVEGASADLAHILLRVQAERGDLWPGDQTDEGGASLYEYGDAGGREPVLVGVKNNGPLKGRGSVNEDAELISRCGTAYNAVSASGEIVYFTALECAGGPAVDELYARIAGSRTVDVSEPSEAQCAQCMTGHSKTTTTEYPAVFQDASTDGSKVFFSSQQELLPGAAGESLYEYDFDAPEGRRVMLLASGVGGVAAVSEDGSRVYFYDSAVLTGDPNGNGEPAVLGASNLYVYDTQTGQTAFVADEAGGIRLTRDGRFAAFESTSSIKGTDNTSTVAQLFEYDAETGLIIRVSVGSPGGYVCGATGVVEQGFDCDGNTTEEEDVPKLTPTGNEGFFSKPTEAASHLSVSEDGAVVFTSALALTPQAVSGQHIGGPSWTENVYEYRAGEVYLLSAADEASPIQLFIGATRLFGIDESGRDVFFATTDSLVPQDGDTQSSWYDAREQGGFPPPATMVSCAGSICHGAPSPPPMFGAPASMTPGSGNLVALPSPTAAVKPKPKSRPVKCVKGEVRKRGKCARRSNVKTRRSSARGRK